MIPFGFGLSYSSFELTVTAIATASATDAGAGAGATADGIVIATDGSKDRNITIMVTNHGPYIGDVVVMVRVRAHVDSWVFCGVS